MNEIINALSSEEWLSVGEISGKVKQDPEQIKNQLEELIQQESVKEKRGVRDDLHGNTFCYRKIEKDHCQWKYQKYFGYHKTECGEEFRVVSIDKYKYCPNCGKKIEHS